MDFSRIRKKVRAQRKGKQTGLSQDLIASGDEAESHDSHDANSASDGGALEKDIHDLQADSEGREELESSSSDDDTQTGEFFVFAIGDECYAFRLSDLHEVLRKQMITHVPRMPDFIVGITSLRGKIIPILDLGKRMGMHAVRKDTGDLQMLIIKGPKGPIAVLIDRVIGVRRIDESLVSGPPPHLEEQQLPLIEAVVRDKDRFVSILHVDHVFDFKPLSLARRTT